MLRCLYRNIRFTICIAIYMFTPAVYALQPSDFDVLISGLTEEGLPVIHLKVNESALNGDTYIEGTITIADALKRTENKQLFESECLIKYRGATAQAYEKKSLSIKFLYPKDSVDRQRNVKLFGIRKEDHWILDAMAIDRIRMRNRVCFDLWNRISRTPYETKNDNRNGTEGLFVELCINDTYRGIYCITDPVNRKLLNLNKQEAGEPGGVLYKGINWKEGNDLLSYNVSPDNSSVCGAWECKYPDVITSDTWVPLQQLINFCGSSSDADFTANYKQYFYKDNIAAYMILTYILNMSDTGWKNCYLSQQRIGEGPFLVTVWDMDNSFGGYWNGNRDETYITYGRMNNIGPFNRLYVKNIDGFRSFVIGLWQIYRTGPFHPDSIDLRLNTYADKFVNSGAWEREYNRWNNNPVPLEQNIQNELSYVKSWYRKNYNILSGLWKSTDLLQTEKDDAQSIHPAGSSSAYTLLGQPVRVEDLPQGTLYIQGGQLHYVP